MSAAAKMTTSPAATGASELAEQFLTFEVGSELFAIPILSVQEIRSWEKVSQIPKTQAHILGVINLRGNVVPVLDVRTRLGLEQRGVTPTTVVIVVRVDDGRQKPATVGCVVDSVSDVMTIAADQVKPAPDTCGSVDSHFISGVTTIDDRLLLMLDIARLIDTERAEMPAETAIATATG